MVLKQGERAEIRRAAAKQVAATKRDLTLANTRQRVETSNLLAGKADITVTDALDTRMTTAEADIAALDARVDTNETNLITQAASLVDHETRISAAETALPLKLEWATVPASAVSTGTAGQLAYEAGFLYVCVAADTWQRVAIATWP